MDPRFDPACKPKYEKLPERKQKLNKSVESLPSNGSPNGRNSSQKILVPRDDQRSLIDLRKATIVAKFKSPYCGDYASQNSSMRSNQFKRIPITATNTFDHKVNQSQTTFKWNDAASMVSR